MNNTLKTILLTVLTLSVFAIALIELSGVSSHALFNKYNIGDGSHAEEKAVDNKDQAKRDEEVKKMPRTTFEVSDTLFDFGTIKEGDKVRHTYMVKNTGTNPLLISNVQVSCGCTAPFFPKEPILPGKTGEVTLEFNSAGKPGTNKKNAMILSNAVLDRFSIGFTAEVEKK